MVSAISNHKIVNHAWENLPCTTVHCTTKLPYKEYESTYLPIFTILSYHISFEKYLESRTRHLNPEGIWCNSFPYNFSLNIPEKSTACNFATMSVFLFWLSSSLIWSYLSRGFLGNSRKNIGKGFLLYLFS